MNGQAAGERAEAGEQTRELVVTLSPVTGEVTRIEHLEKDGRRREFTPEEYAAVAAYYAGAPAAPVTLAAAAAEADAAAPDPAAYDPYGYARAYTQGAGDASTGMSAAAAAYTTDQLAYFQGALDASTALASLAAAYAAMPTVLAYYQGMADFMAART
ncbi:MAG TPA: hypothetical protein VHG08_27290 [Longimicrobium sp.]|nr:hypothetical protein [Longimicrobium sp.]